ncbi:hypothetical protein [Streptomyces viridochromogenes]|uniref:LigA protein n=1 Tax=Streptomyces viridochromogenes Tue57 TaxID=1160705 RepID=L8PU16_STRVR|nr:hypothetical protein [Streptomyces viridochromogenes]ELS58897.1 hypothetical protein STVIR_0150 [Streptomyces viridochromogenes Tue57]
MAGAIGAVSGIALGQVPSRAEVPTPRTQGWQAVPAPGSTPAAQLRRIAAAGPRLAWAVGEEGRAGPSQGRGLAMLWNGSGWTKTDLSHLNHTRLSDVAGMCATAAWSVGQPAGNGSPLLRWDGTTWREAPFPGLGEPDVRLNSVAVGPDGRVWICGSRGGAARLLLGDGQRWRWLDPLPVASGTLYRVVLRSPDEVWVSGDQSNGGGWSGLVARWDGAWTVLPPVAGLRLGIADVHSAGPDDVWAVGTEAGIGGPPGRPGNPALSHWDGTAWTRLEAGFTVGSLTGIAGDAQGRAAWISGWNYQDQSRSTYLRRDGGGAWTVVRGAAGVAPAPYLNDVTSVPGGTGFWSVGMTSPSPAPPTEAYTERLEA